jgi:hypothetical protein
MPSPTVAMAALGKTVDIMDGSNQSFVATERKGVWTAPDSDRKKAREPAEEGERCGTEMPISRYMQ